jgi:undecaprenyl-diphosphatase
VIQAIILGLVQGATEFLPVSSSGHLVLVPWILGWQPPGVAFDAILHLGTLLAVVGVFWRELGGLLKNLALSIKERSLSGARQRKVAWLLILATLPAVVIGFLFEDLFASLFARPAWVGVLLLITGSFLAASERWSRRALESDELSWLDAVIIGIAQAAAIAPGISRSGATVSAGLWRGLRREASARFSFLLSVPIIAGAGLFEVKGLLEAPEFSISLLALLGGFLAAAIGGFLSIEFLLSYLRTRRLYPFAAYCWAVGSFAVVLSLFSNR